MKGNWYIKKLVVRFTYAYGIQGISYNWFQNYLHKCTQYVKIEDIRSNEETIVYGIPQGPTLGPLLFLPYVNDLPIRPLDFLILLMTLIFFLNSCSNEKESGVSKELALVLRYCATQYCLK